MSWLSRDLAKNAPGIKGTVQIFSYGIVSGPTMILRSSKVLSLHRLQSALLLGSLSQAGVIIL